MADDDREPLPLGVLPHITDTDPPPLHPDTITGPPEVIDVPYVAQEGATLTCTTGNWTNLPTSYAYQWQLDGVDVGDNAPAYDLDLPAYDGKVGACFVTATNDRGETTAPQSNAVTIGDAAARRSNPNGPEHERNHTRHGPARTVTVPRPQPG